MDTSKKYILMCNQAKEIQKFRLDTAQWQDGDFAYTKGDETEGGEYSECVKIIWNNKLPHGGYHNWDSNWYMPDGCIWLPRQDQLQALVMPEYEVYGCDAIEHFMNDFHGFQEENNPLFDSMEELTLAFVMDYNYQKEWTGTEWKTEVMN